MSVGCDEGSFRFPEECCFSSLCSDEGSQKNANNVILGAANQRQNSVLFYSVAGNVIRNVVDLFCGLLSTVSSPPCSSII